MADRQTIPTAARRWPQRVLIGLGGVLGLTLLLILLLLGTLIVTLATESGTRWAVRTATDLLRSQDVADVRIGAVEGALLDAVTLRGIAVADAEGIWVTADRLALAWRPLALVSGRLEIEALETTAVDLSRLPAGPDEATADEGGGGFNPALLGRLRLEAFALDGVHLGAEVLGTEVTVRAEGRLIGQMPGDVRAETRLERLDGPGHAVFEATYAADGTLDVVADVVEPSGVVAGLAGLPGTAATRLHLEGAGPAGDWRGTLSAEVKEVAALAGDVGLSVTAARQTLTLDTRLEPGPQAPAELRAFARPAITLRGAVDLEDRRTTVRGLDLGSDGWAVSGTGMVEADGAIKADLTADLRDGAPVRALADMPLGTARVAVAVTGTLDSPRLTASVEATDTVVEQVTAEIKAAVDTDIAIEASGRVAGVSAEVPDLAPLVGDGIDWRLSGTVRGDGTAARIDRFTAEGAQVSADMSGTVSLAPIGFQGVVNARVAQLGALAALTGAPLQGDARLRAQIEAAGPDQAAGPVTLTIDGFSVGDAVADRLVGGRLTAGARLEVTQSGLAVVDAEITAPGAALTASRLTMPGYARLEGGFEATVPSLALLDVGVSGGVRASGTVAGPLADPRVMADVTGTDVVVSDVAIAPLRARAEVTAERLALSAIAARVHGVALSGTAQLPYASGLIEGDLQGEVVDAAAVTRFAGVRVDGPAVVTASLAPQDGTQSARLLLSAEDLRLPQADGQVARLEAQAVLQDAFGAMRGTLDATLGPGRVGAVTWREVGASGRLDGAAGTASVALSGFDRDGARAAIEADVDFSGADLRGRLRKLSLDAKGHEVRLMAPADVRIGAGTVALSPLRLALDDGRLVLEGERGPREITATLRGQSVPLDLANLLLGPDTLAGRADVSASLAGPVQEPRGDLSLTLRDMRVPEADVAGVVVEASGRLRGGRFRVDATVAGISDRPATLRGDVPLTFDAAGMPSVPGTAPLSAAFEWSGPVQAVWALVPQVGHRLSGQAEVSARVGGTLDALEFQGDAAVRGGRYENLEWGTVLDALEARASLARTGGIEVSLRGTDGGKGRLSGTAAIAPVQGAPDAVRADLSFTDAMLVRRDDLRAQADGEISYRGSLTVGRVEGRITTDAVEVRLTDTLGGGAPELNVIEVGADVPAEPQPRAGENGAGREIALDLTVDIPARLFVRGQGLESEWQGDLAITGTVAAPRIRGALQVRRGFIDFIGRRFDLTAGRVDLTGGEKVNPEISVKAEHDAGDITGILSVTGTPDDISLGMSSRPALPEDEVLSRILFGKNFGRLGPGQAVAVAQAAASLTGNGGGFDLTGLLRSGMGLDVLTFGGDEDSGPTVEAGKYVTEDVYVGVEQGTGSTSGAVTVEVEITPRVSIETKGSAAAGADIGINYKFDY